jgi:polar amino acid transport system substrate-binding protein
MQKNRLFLGTGLLFIIPLISIGILFQVASAADIELSQNSTLEGILKRGKLRVGFEVGYLPFEMIDKRSGMRKRGVSHGDLRHGSQQMNIIGFDVDIAIEMAKALGVKLVTVDTLWPSIIPALNLGRFDIIMGGMSITEARKQRVDFANPLMIVGQTILLSKKHEGKVSSYKDLDDPQFIVVSKPATTGEEAVKKFIPRSSYQSADTEIKGAEMVLNGKADAFVYDLPFNALFITMHGEDKLVFLDETFTVEPIAWAVRKNDPDFLKWLNQFCYFKSSTTTKCSTRGPCAPWTITSSMSPVLLGPLIKVKRWVNVSGSACCCCSRMA